MKNLYKEQIKKLKTLIKLYEDILYGDNYYVNNFGVDIKIQIVSLDTQIEQSEKNPPKQLTEEKLIKLLCKTAIHVGLPDAKPTIENVIKGLEMANCDVCKTLASELLSLQEAGEGMYDDNFIKWVSTDTLYQKPKNNWLILGTTQTFDTLPELFEYYKSNVQGK